MDGDRFDGRTGGGERRRAFQSGGAVAGPRGEGSVDPWTLKDIMKRLNLETYEDAIFIIGFVPVSNERVRQEIQRYRTQFYLQPMLNKPAKFTIIQGGKIFDTQLLRESSGVLPLVNPVDKNYFQAVWTGDAAKLVGVEPDSGTFVFIVEPIKTRYDVLFDNLPRGGMGYAYPKT